MIDLLKDAKATVTFSQNGLLFYRLLTMTSTTVIKYRLLTMASTTVIKYRLLTMASTTLIPVQYLCWDNDREHEHISTFLLFVFLMLVFENISSI